MSREISEISTDLLAEAIGHLRDRLTVIEGKKVSQDAMARRLGCTVRSYVRWESGEGVPSGDWLLKILMICPDLESLKAFGIQVAGLPRVASPTQEGREDEDLIDRSPVLPVRRDGRIKVRLKRTPQGELP